MTATSVLVVGATGTQGGSVVDRLLAADGFDVHGLTRYPDADPARALADSGVTVHEGDLGSKASLLPAFGAVDAVYGMTDFWSAGYEGEVEQGTNLVEAAVEAGVDHVVFSSIESCDEKSEIPVMDAKHRIERRLADADVPATVLRTHNFMENFERQREEILDGSFVFPLEEGVPMRLVATDDIGTATAMVLSDPETYAGETLELAGDEHTVGSMAETFGTVAGVEVDSELMPPEVVRGMMGEAYVDMFEWFNRREYAEDLETVKSRVGIEFTTLEEYLWANGWGA